MSLMVPRSDPQPAAYTSTPENACGTMTSPFVSTPKPLTEPVSPRSQVAGPLLLLFFGKPRTSTPKKPEAQLPLMADDGAFLPWSLPSRVNAKMLLGMLAAASMWCLPCEDAPVPGITELLGDDPLPPEQLARSAAATVVQTAADNKRIGRILLICS